MRFLNKIMFNRLVAIITTFILAVLKLFSKSDIKIDNIPVPPDERKPIFPNLRKRIDDWKK
jgi:hypothetical protein